MNLDFSKLPKPDWADEKFGVALYCGDCFDICGNADFPTVESVATDPPYKVEQKYGEGYNDSRDGKRKYFKRIVDLAKSLSESIAVIPGTVNLFEYPTPNNMFIRYDSTMQSPSRIAYLNKYEPILIYGNPLGAKPAWDVVETKTSTSKHSIEHPCPKGLDLMVYIVRMISSETTLDLFMGSGTTGVAAVSLGRSFIGIELDEEYFKIAVKRIKQAIIDAQGGELFAEHIPDDKGLFDD